MNLIISNFGPIFSKNVYFSKNPIYQYMSSKHSKILNEVNESVFFIILNYQLFRAFLNTLMLQMMTRRNALLLM